MSRFSMNANMCITEVGLFVTLTYTPTENYNSERNNKTGTRYQFWLYCVIGRLFLSKMETYFGMRNSIKKTV